MAIRGATKKPLPFVLEDDQSNPENEQTIFWISPKKGHDANETMRRYAAAGRDGRKGYRELSVRKLDAADIEEFLAIVYKVENYIFSEDMADKYWKDGKETGVTLDTPVGLADVCRDLSSDHLIEIIEVANNVSKLTDYQKKSSSS